MHLQRRMNGGKGFFEDVMKNEFISSRMSNIMGGDFDVCLNSTNDLSNYSDLGNYTKIHKKSMRALKELFEHDNLQDLWEVYKSNYSVNKALWTWKQGGPTIRGAMCKADRTRSTYSIQSSQGSCMQVFKGQSCQIT